MKIGVAKAVRLARVAALAVGAAALTSGAIAQTVPDMPDQTVPDTGLDLPDNLQLYGKQDPNIRKPTAIVNDTVITGTDVDQRVAMIIALNNFHVTDQDRERLRLQILRQLIDETLQIQEAKANDITISGAQIDQSFARVSRNFNRTPDQMREWLRSVGSSDKSMRRQIEGEMAWSRLLSHKVEPFVNVGDEEVAAIMQKLKNDKGTEEYHLKEIYLGATTDRAQEVIAAEQKMIEQMRSGAPFEYFARNFSEASTRARDGDLGWVRLAVLPESLSQVASTMQLGQIAGPIDVGAGYSILYLADKRQVLTADPRDATLSLRQISLTLPKGLTEAQIAAKAADFGKSTQATQGCGDAGKMAASLGAQVVDKDNIRVRDLPPQLQDIMLQLQVGQATQPFRSSDTTVSALVLCGRDDPQSANMPSADQIQQQLEEERVNLRAARMLRDLRRDALVEYR